MFKKRKFLKLLNIVFNLLLTTVFIISHNLIFSLNISFAEQPKSLFNNLSEVRDSNHYFQKASKYLAINKRAKYQVLLENYQSNSLEDKPTWIVVHGFGHSPLNLEDQELQQNLKASGFQVLQVDWSSITKRSIWSLWSASEFIPPVGKFIADSLIEGKFLSGENLNCIGHSFGSYICWEIAKRIENFNRIIALEPASKKGMRLPWKKFYDISRINLSEYNKYSWSFRSSDQSSERVALTADDSFLIEYRDYPESRHNDVIGFISNLIRRNHKGEGGNVSRVLDVSNMDKNTLHPWSHDSSDYKGIILIQNENNKGTIYRWLPVLLRYKNGVINEYGSSGFVVENVSKVAK